MNKDSLSRREFVRLGAGAIGLGALSGAARAKPESLSELTHDQGAQTSAGGRRATDSEMQMADDMVRSFGAPQGGWKKHADTGLLPEAIKPPFSFRYGGRESSDLLPGWKCESKTSDIDGVGTRHEITYADPQTELVVRVSAILFRNFPAAEWVIHFKNEGASETPILEEVQALDTWLLSRGGDPTIHYAAGATCSMNDFMPLRRDLNLKGELHLEPGGGRSSSDFLPFFNIETKGEGAIVAIGWTGEWATNFSHSEGENLQVRAGMALTHLKLLPGEEIRTPRILNLFWQSDRMRGHNMLRQFILAHHRPQAGEKPVSMPICNANWGGTPAATHLENIKQMVAHRLPMDYYWIDAEWFGHGPWWENTGDWQIKKDLYPQGFKPISDFLHSSGLKFLLWFEPERVCEGTPWYTEQAKWLLEVPKDRRVYNWGTSQEDPLWVRNESLRNQIKENDRLFNLSIPEARQFLTDFISNKIEEWGIDCFRHDANIAPLEFWRAADAPDRQGITEIRWVEGLYAFWDELVRRHPDLVIDVCASGGRRIDLETVGRCLPLTRTDFHASNTGNQCHTYGLHYWVPLNSTLGGESDAANLYDIRSSMSSGLVFGLFGNGDAPQTRKDYNDFPFERVKRILEQQRGVERYFYGDYYPLTEYSQAEDAWIAYQLDVPEEKEGLVVVLKRPASPYTRAIFPLKALRKDASYEITNLDTDRRTTLLGGQLMSEGLELFLLKKPDSALIHYRQRET
jgi:alpha-galactosidase